MAGNMIQKKEDLVLLFIFYACVFPGAAAFGLANVACCVGACTVAFGAAIGEAIFWF